MALPQELVESLTRYILLNEGKVKELAVQLANTIKATESLAERENIVNELGGLFKSWRYSHFVEKQENGQTVTTTERTNGVANPEFSKRIQGLKAATTQKLDGKKTDNLKSVILGVYNAQTNFKSKAFHTAFPDNFAHPISPNDPNRFQRLTAKKNPNVYGVIGSSYAGQQNLPAESRHVEDAVYSQTLRVGGSKVTIMAIGDGLGNHQEMMDSVATSRSSYFATKSLTRILASHISSQGIDALTEEALRGEVFQSVLRETTQKGNIFTTGGIQPSTTFAATVLIETPGQRNKLVAFAMGDCMIFTYDAQKKTFTTLAGAVERGMGPAGIPHQYTAGQDIPYVSITRLNDGEVPVLVSDGIHDELPKLWMLKAPMAYIDAKSKNDEVTFTDRHLVTGGQVIQVDTEAEKNAIKSHPDFEFGTDPVIANLNTPRMEELFAGNDLSTPQKLVEGILGKTIAITDRRRATAIEGQTRIGDDATIVTVFPESVRTLIAAAEQKQGGGLSRFFGRGGKEGQGQKI
jgi:hypothetical protein